MAVWSQSSERAWVVFKIRPETEKWLGTENQKIAKKINKDWLRKHLKCKNSFSYVPDYFLAQTSCKTASRKLQEVSSPAWEIVQQTQAGCFTCFQPLQLLAVDRYLTDKCDSGINLLMKHILQKC